MVGLQVGWLFMSEGSLKTDMKILGRCSKIVLRDIVWLVTAPLPYSDNGPEMVRASCLLLHSKILMSPRTYLILHLRCSRYRRHQRFHHTIEPQSRSQRHAIRSRALRCYPCRQSRSSPTSSLRKHRMFPCMDWGYHFIIYQRKHR